MAYKILIVDDERRCRTSGSNVRRWNGYGIKANKVYDPTD